MVQVDYETIDLLLQNKRISRRQLAKLIGVSPDTLAGSFRRNSKMKVFQLYQIASILSVEPIDLLLPDNNGNYNLEDLKKVEAGKSTYDEFFINGDKIDEITDILSKLNQKGLYLIKVLANELCNIPEMKAPYSVITKSFSGEGYLSEDDMKELNLKNSEEGDE